jgi:hypothetical protein
MASQGDPTRPQASAPPPPPPPGHERIDLSTLFLSAVASAAAAYVTSKIWAAGTLFSAAMSPVIVALVKEALRKPTDIVTAAVPAVARPLRGSAAQRAGRAAPARGAAMPDDLTEHLAAGAPPPYPPPAPGAEAGPVRVYSTRSRRLRWRLAIVTGLLGFAACVVLYTVPEIIAGNSVGRSGHSTTFFPGRTKHRSTSTTTTETQTVTRPDTSSTPATTTPTVTQTVTTPATPPATTPTTPVPGATVPPATEAPTVPGTPPASTTP